RDRWTASLIVVNPSPAARGGVVEATATLFREDVTVGRPGARLPRATAGPPPAFRLTTADGTLVPVQVLGVYPAYERLDSPREYPDQDEVWAGRLGGGGG